MEQKDRFEERVFRLIATLSLFGVVEAPKVLKEFCDSEFEKISEAP